MNKTVLITGASRGLGYTLALTFLTAGWRVIANSLHNSSGLGELKLLGADIVAGSVSVAGIREELAMLVNSGLDLLINNAAVRPITDFCQITDKEVSDTIITNLVAPILLTKCVWRSLKKSKGMVVNINSLAGKHGGENETAYSASKFGLRGFAESLQYEGTRDDVRVLSVFVAAMKTSMCTNRPDYDKLIEQIDVAQTILQLNVDRPSLRVTEIDLCRRNY